MKNKTLFCFLLSLMAFCLGGSKNAFGQEFRLPEVPGELRTVESRAGWIVVHFWDEMDFRREEARYEEWMEQPVVDFLSVLKLAAPKARAEAIGLLLEKAAADEEAYSVVETLVERYLYEWESPMRNDEVYAEFLRKDIEVWERRWESSVDYVDEHEGGGEEGNEHEADAVAHMIGAWQVMLEMQLDEVTAMGVGSVAPDFKFVDLKGREVWLSEAVKGDGLALVVFYDPECESCKKLTGAIGRSKGISQAVREGRLDVVFVYVEDAEIPSDYHLRGLPTAFLLDGGMKVVGRHVGVEDVEEAVSGK